MKAYIFSFFITGAFLLALSGCSDKYAVIDQNTEIPDRNWAYANTLKFDVNITDEHAAYNVYMNLRVTADYKYSNMFVLVAESATKKVSHVQRYELTLANREGMWLGNGSGNLYSYQLRFINRYKFPAKGIYHFYIEQNMRDNPLREVSDVGLRVEKAH
jgi:gliding motility-associated lipoprotein GldH